MVEKIEIQGTPTTGYSMRCPHRLNIQKRITYSTLKARYNFSKPQYKDVPLFVGSVGCEKCEFNTTKRITYGKRCRFVFCSYPVKSREVQEGEIRGLRRGNH